MPTYQYACQVCGHQFEIRQRFSEDPLTVCPECNGRIQRIINPVGIIFKGSGFYITDNKSNHSLNGTSHNGNSNGASKTNSTGKKTEATKTKADAS